MTDLRDFVSKGWLVVSLSESSRAIVEEGRALLLRVLRDSVSPAMPSIERYHESVQEDSRHTELQALLSTEFQNARIANRIICAELPLWQSLIGTDLHVQRFPYLRIARP